MAEAVNTSRGGSPPEPDTGSVRSTRVDGPHVVSRGDTTETPESAGQGHAGAAMIDEQAARAWLAEVLPRLRRQARQLAAHLQTRQQDLDRREAEINARIALLENGERAARIWLAARRSELSEWEEALKEREQALAAHQQALARAEQDRDGYRGELAARAQELSELEARLSRRQQALDELEASLRQREQSLQQSQAALDAVAASLDEGQRELERGRAWLEGERIALARRAEEQQAAMLAAEAELAQRRATLEAEQATAEAALAARAQALAEREADLDARGAALAKHAALAQGNVQHGVAGEACQVPATPAAMLQAGCAADELARREEELAARAAEQEAAFRLERQRFADSVRRWEARLARQRQALARQSERLDRRKAALEKSRAEVAELHREALEWRIVTEELWAELTGWYRSGALQQTVAELRRRLAEHYRLAAADAAEQRQALAAMRDELAAAADRLAQARRELVDWAELRSQELALQQERHRGADQGGLAARGRRRQQRSDLHDRCEPAVSAAR